MDVAAISVVSSGLVAVGSLLLQWRNAAEQRKHDAIQAFESRAWELKREGHLELLNVLSRMRNQIHDGYLVASSREMWLEDLYVAQSPILAYGTDECRWDLESLARFLRDIEPVDVGVNTAVLHALAMDDELQDAFRPEGNRPLTAALQNLRTAEQRVREAFVYDDLRLVALTEKLVASARSSLRGGL